MSDDSLFTRENWRVTLAILLFLGSLLLVFGVVNVPTTQQSTDGVTTLKFGLQLDGGTRIQAPLHGVTAEGVEISNTNTTASKERAIAAHLSNVSVTDVNIVLERTPQNETTVMVEVTSKNATKTELASALRKENITYDTIRQGVTEQTREQTVAVIQNKINQAGLSGGTVRTVRTASGRYHILIEIPGEDKQDVINLLDQRGSVRVDLYYPVENETGKTVYKTREGVLEQGDFQQVGQPEDDPQYGPNVPVTLTQPAAQQFKKTVIETGMAPSGSTCSYETAPNESGPCLLTKVDGEVIYAAGMSPRLARNIANGSWTQNPSFILQTENLSEAQQLALHLQAGQLPTSINFDEGSIVTVSPTQGKHFKTGSLIIGLLALLAVSIKVYSRYRDPRIVIPMILVSISEVTILAGFATLVGYPIDLSVVAGFVAVIGTGVDDLIIVANEVLKKGEVNSSKVFRNRFNKAFWVIGAAALTTIVALSPLIVFGLGQLAGFAIFTIVGILVGVFVTRPAYGDYLNYVLIDDDY